MPPPLVPRKLVSARDVAVYYGISMATLYRWLKLGLIPEPVRIGGRTLWNVGELEEHLASLRAKHPAA